MGWLRPVGDGLNMAFGMCWQTLWALVLGFALSGAVQAFVNRAEMQAALGSRGPRTLARAGLLGAASSSCSYAAAALAKTLFARGADFTAAVVFMVASTNLVVELGLVLWLLIGWQFALAELIGGVVIIALIGVALPRLVRADRVEPARLGLQAESTTAKDPHAAHAGHSGHGDAATAEVSLPQRLRRAAGWRAAARATMADLGMVRRELVIGFLVSGFLGALVPTSVWQSVFLTGHGGWSTLENVVVGPFIAVISFVCSVGNVPLAAALWQGGISFGGVVSFVFADLITLPLLVIYRRYYGASITWRLLGCFWAAMSLAGLVVEGLFAALRVPAPSRVGVLTDLSVGWNHTTSLNIVALLAFGVILLLSRRPEPADAGTLLCRTGLRDARQEASGPPMSILDHEHPIDADRVGHARTRLPSAEDAARLTGLLSMLADPVRLRLVYALDVVEELCVGDLALALDVSEDAVSYALRLLRTAGLVVTRKQGRVVYNRLADDFPEPLRDHCLRQLVALTRRAD